MNVREITSEERRRAEELFGIAFECSISKDSPDTPLPDNVRLWGCFDGDDMASCMTLKEMPVNFDGSVCQMTGIGGVSTLPQYRRQGCIRSIFQAALPHMYRSGVDFSYLYPFSTAFYRQFGYENCVQQLEVTLRLSDLRVPPVSGFFQLADARHPLADEIRQLDQLREHTFNMMVQHQDSFYDWVRNADPTISQEYTYVWFNSDRTPRAYLTYRKENRHDGCYLVCSRFCFADREGFNGLMSLFRSVSSDHDYAAFRLPACSGMQHLIPEWALGGPRFNLVPCGMARVVNVSSVLQKARCHGSGSLTLAITDDFIPENNGTFAVAFEAGKVASVTRTRQPADASMTIGAFSALIGGVVPFDEAAACLTGLTVHNEGACLAQLFLRKQQMIVDFF